MTRDPHEDLKLAGLAHDLNNVFQTLVDSADQLQSDPRWQPLAAAILRCVERGRQITVGLFRAETAGTPFEQILSNAIAFVEDMRAAARAPAVRFACDVQPGIVLSGNWAWERVLINLFLNAARAMPEGGAIHVSARLPEAGKAHITVTDEGPGIPPELLDHLFEPHVSGSGSTGLGLHIVRTIVEEQGGSIQARNRSGARGAEFTIQAPGLPRRIPEEGAGRVRNSG